MRHSNSEIALPAGNSPILQEANPNHDTVRQGEVKRTPVPMRALPKDESWFETTWAAWQSGQIFRDA